MNASAYPHDTDTFGWRTRHAAALLASSASLLSRVFAVVLALVLGGLGWLALATIEDAERVSVALFLSGLAVAALWGIWFARLLLLHIEAHRSRMPGVAMAIGGTVALVFLVTVLVPALLLSGALDPVTPPRYGDAVLEGLSNGRHLVVEGQGHGTLTLGCMPKLVGQFIESTDAAALDTACLDRLAGVPPFTSFNGWEP